MTSRFHAFLAVNAALDADELCGQLAAMRRAGFDGVVWQPRFYPGVPEYLGDEYLGVLSRVILHAKSLGLEFWIYDENGWPSGTAGGETLRRHPHLRQQWIELSEEPVGDVLAGFERQGKSWHLVRRFGEGVDYLDPALAPAFLELTHERYRTGLDPAAFEHVSVFFCDEPEFGIGHAIEAISPHGALPWGDAVADFFHQRQGIEILDFMEDLFFEGVNRQMFIEGLTDLFNQGFTAPIDAWCRAHGKRFTAHVKGEEHPLFQIAMVGSCQPFFEALSLPAIDALERHPSGDFFPRQVATAAHQFGDGRCMVEAFGGAGWGASPADLERYFKWLAGHGLTDFVCHLWQYQLTSHAIRDWPVSFPNHVTWEQAFPAILDRVRAHAAGVETAADTLVIAPYRALMRAYVPADLPQANIHNGSQWPAGPAQRVNDAFLDLIARVQATGWGWHVSDERSIERHARFENGALCIGRAGYTRVILGRGVEIDGSLLYRMKPLLARVPLVGAVEEADVALSVPASLPWQVQPSAVNQLVLEAERVDGLFHASFESEDGLAVALKFADPVSEVVANGVAGASFTTRAGTNTVRFRCEDPRPWLAVTGAFAVSSDTPWNEGPNGTRATAGPFRLVKSAAADPADLLASGHPFAFAPLGLTTRVEIPEGSRQLRLHVAADAARVHLDGHDLGWTWGPDWQLALPEGLSSGDHPLRIELHPSTFNSYGPHHHLDGDRPVVSPVQYEYRRNFADRPDAPACTRVDAWHFNPLSATGVTFLP